MKWSFPVVPVSRGATDIKENMACFHTTLDSVVYAHVWMKLNSSVISNNKKLQCLILHKNTIFYDLVRTMQTNSQNVQWLIWLYTLKWMKIQECHHLCIFKTLHKAYMWYKRWAMETTVVCVQYVMKCFRLTSCNYPHSDNRFISIPYLIEYIYLLLQKPRFFILFPWKWTDG